HLRSGGLIAYPTETVYGVGSRPRAADVAALQRLKGRRPDKPFLLLVSHRDMAEAQGLAFTPAASALARAFWPGPLSLVLPGGSGQLPDLLRGPEGGIAVRWTSHRGMAQLVQVLGEPITSTSANLPGQPPAPGAAARARPLGAPRPSAHAGAGRPGGSHPDHGPPSSRPRRRAGRREPCLRAGRVRRARGRRRRGERPVRRRPRGLPRHLRRARGPYRRGGGADRQRVCERWKSALARGCSP